VGAGCEHACLQVARVDPQGLFQLEQSVVQASRLEQQTPEPAAAVGPRGLLGDRPSQVLDGAGQVALVVALEGAIL
jgi:hypothetical protein